MALTITRRVSVTGAAMLVLPLVHAGDGGRSSARTPRAMTAAVRFHVPPDHPDRWFIELSGYEPGRSDGESGGECLGASAGRALPGGGLRGEAIGARVALAVYAVPAGGEVVDGVPPLLGRYEPAGTTLRLVPRFAPAPGVTYIARCAACAVEARFTLPPAKTEPLTRVTAIYPTIDRVPGNLLKLYVEFSAPMRDGEAEQRLHLFDARGREMPRAFLHVDAELWNDTHTRLTVLFDPGRIKRGLRANLEAGAPLAAGQTFRLAIDPAWRDGHGAALVASFEKTLTVGPADRTSPDWRRWTVAQPKAGTRDAVTVRFDEPIDRALLDRWLVVVDASGASVPGRATVGSHETSWSFIPEHGWRGDRYHVLVDPRLEDLAGNSLTSLFDADIAAQPRRDTKTPIALAFTP